MSTRATSLGYVRGVLLYRASSNFFSKSSTADHSSPVTRRSRTPTMSQISQPLYIIVFGYPPDKYSVTAEYFKSLGDSTDADPNTEITNCFRIGYRDPGDAMRAVRKNGEILAGSWMVGAKWAVSACFMSSSPWLTTLMNRIQRRLRLYLDRHYVRAWTPVLRRMRWPSMSLSLRHIWVPAPRR